MPTYLRERNGSLSRARSPGDRRNQSYAQQVAQREGRDVQFVAGDGRRYTTDGSGNLGRIENIGGKDVSIKVSQAQVDEQGKTATDRQIEINQAAAAKKQQDQANAASYNAQLRQTAYINQQEQAYIRSQPTSKNERGNQTQPPSRSNAGSNLPGSNRSLGISPPNLQYADRNSNGNRGNPILPQNTTGQVLPARKTGFGENLASKGDEYTTSAQRSSGIKQSGFVIGAIALKLPRSGANIFKTLGNIFNPSPEKNTVVLVGKETVDIGKETFATKNVLTPLNRIIVDPLLDNPTQFASDSIASYGVGKAVSFAIPKATDIYVKAGSKYVPPEEVFSPQVLAGGKQFPLATSTPDNLAQFNKGRTPDGSVLVNTASPGSLKGTVAGAGSKGGLPVPLEDPGVYVSAKGQGSPAFLRVTGETSGYTLNPIKAFKPSVPTVTEFKAKDILLQPRDVVNTPGFGAAADFLESQSSTGKAFITKRSEIGQGSVPRQQFAAETPFESPFPRTVLRNGKVVPGQTKILKDDILTEAGTSELEAVIPPGAKFAYTPETTLGKIKGFDEYTTYEGRAVALRKADLLTGDSATAPGLGTVKPDFKVVSGKEIATEQSSFASSVSKPKQFPLLFKSNPTNSKQGFSTQVIKQGNSAAASAPKTTEVSTLSTLSSTPRSSVEVSTMRSVAPSSPTSRTSRRGGSSRSGTSTPSGLGGSGSEASTPASSTPSGGSSSGFGGSSGSGFSRGTSKGSNTPAYPYMPQQKKPTSYLPTSSKKEKGQEGFNVLVRRKGVFQKANAVALTKNQARAFGAYDVRNSAAASFKIVRAGTKAEGSFFGNSDLPEFYKSKKEPDTFIQKASKRISTLGELRDITFKAGKSSGKKRRSVFG